MCTEKMYLLEHFNYRWDSVLINESRYYNYTLITTGNIIYKHVLAKAYTRIGNLH